MNTMKNAISKCCKAQVRYLDCEECREKGEFCGVIICCVCGEEVNDNIEKVELKDGENTCDRCKDVWKSEDLVWISAEDFTPKEGEVLPDRIYGEYQALCEPCYLGLLI